MRESKAIYQNSNNVIYIHKPEPKEIDEHIKKQKNKHRRIRTYITRWK